MISLPLMRYVLTAALRDKIIVAMAVMMALVASASIFLGGVAVVEQSYFSIVFTASGVRLGVVLGLILFVSFYVRRMFDSKEVEFILTRPMSRISFVASMILSFLCLALFLALVQFGCMVALSYPIFHSGYVLWGVSILTENMIIVAAAFFFAMHVSSASVCAIATFGFYALSRMMGQILGVLDADTPTLINGVLGYVMNAISLVIPRLDLTAQSSWLIYGIDHVHDIYIVVAQGIIFTIFLSIATAIDLVRRQF